MKPDHDLDDDGDQEPAIHDCSPRNPSPLAFAHILHRKKKFVGKHLILPAEIWRDTILPFL